jgi:hypothetical protein
MSLATGRHSMHYDMMCGVTLALFRGGTGRSLTVALRTAVLHNGYRSPSFTLRTGIGVFN